MNARPSPPVRSRPRTTTPTNLVLRSSTAGWYAAWKAKKADAQAPAEPDPKADATEALVRWLSGGGEK